MGISENFIHIYAISRFEWLLYKIEKWTKKQFSGHAIHAVMG